MENMKKLIGKFIFMSAAAVIICFLPIFTIKVKALDIIDPVIYRADGTPAVKGIDWKYYPYDGMHYWKEIDLLKNNLIIYQTAIEGGNTYYSINDDCSDSGQHTFYFKDFNVDGKTTGPSLFIGENAVKLYFDQCNINIISNDTDSFEVISGCDIEILGDPSGTNNELSISTSIGSCIGIYPCYDLSTRLVLGNDDNFKIKLTSNEYYSICDNSDSADLIINKGTDLLCNGTIYYFSNIDIYGKMDVICNNDSPCFELYDNLKSFNVNQSSDLFLSTNYEDGVFLTSDINKEFLNLDNVLVGASENFGSRDDCNRILKYAGDGCYKVVVNDEFKVPKSIHFCGVYSVIINGVEAYYLRGEKIEKPSDPTDEKGGTFIGWYIEGTDTKWDFDSEVKGVFKSIYTNGYLFEKLLNYNKCF